MRTTVNLDDDLAELLPQWKALSHHGHAQMARDAP